MKRLKRLPTIVANNIALIEDCAISLGSRISGNHVGSFGDASFLVLAYLSL